MSEIQKYAKEARTSPDLETGLFEKADGTQWIRNPDGTETPVIGAGSSQTLAQTLALGNDANALKITNLADGVDPQDAATLSQIGGSQPVAVTRVAFAFDTPDILTGIPVFTPAADELVALAGISVSEAFNGTTPIVRLFSQGDDPDADDLLGNNGGQIAFADTPIGGHAVSLSAPFIFITFATLYADATPILLALTDGSGGAPGGSTGEGVLILLRFTAP